MSDKAVVDTNILDLGAAGVLHQRALRDYLAWEVVVNDGDSILDAIELEGEYKISFWDALIVQAATNSRASVLYSEDLSHGQSYSSTTVVNLFLS